MKATYSRIIFVLLICVSLFVTPFFQISSNFIFTIDPSLDDRSNVSSSDSKIDSLLWKYGAEFPGNGPTTDPILVNFSQDSSERIVLGTDEGIVVMSKYGEIVMSYRTDFPVIAFDIIEDIDGDSLKDIVLITYTTKKENVLAISSNQTALLWEYKNSIEDLIITFEIHPLYYKEEIKNVWDLVLVKDINHDGISEIAISSQSSLILLDGATGEEIWEKKDICSNNIWKIVYSDDQIIAGSGNGKLIGINLEGKLQWIFQVPWSIANYTENSVIYQKEVPNAIDDILIVEDCDDDGISDIISTSDDGFCRLHSGATGIVIKKLKVYYMATLFSYFYDVDDSPYHENKRIFQHYGVKIYPFSGLNNSDFVSFVLIANGLENYKASEKRAYISFLSFNEANDLKLCSILNISYHYYLDLSNPFLRSYSNRSYIYFADSNSLIRYNLTNNGSTYESILSEDLGISLLSMYTHNRIIPMTLTDFNSSNLLLILDNEKSNHLVDLEKRERIWQKYRDFSFQTKIIKDYNKDGTEELVIIKRQTFYNEWLRKEENLISSLSVLDSSDGSILWSYSFASSPTYGGFQDIKSIGDLNDDGFDEYVGWIIPSTITSDVRDFFQEFGIPYSAASETIRRTGLYNFTKIQLINGYDGSLILEKRLPNSIYDFMRWFDYEGTYKNPYNITNKYHNFYLRTNEKVDPSWMNNFDDFRWEGYWDPATLLHPNDLSVAIGKSRGNITNLNQYAKDISVSSENDFGVWNVLLNLSIPVDLDSQKRLGLLEYPLSQLERIAAMKMQTELSVNDTSFLESYRFSYELFNELNRKWVTCSWNESNRFWNDKYSDLHGDYRNTYRNSFNHFNFDTNSRRDDMYVITRGVADDTFGVDNGIDFDFKNETTLSSFIDSKNELKIRINITNSQAPFNVTFQSFGAKVFYWGLFGTKFESNYIREFSDLYSSNSYLTSKNLLDLRVQDFEVINSTGDKYSDLIVVLGEEDEECSIGTRIILFDFKNNQNKVIWGIDRDIVPIKKMGILNLNSSLNNLVLSGRFYTKNNESYYAHKRVESFTWTDYWSFFYNYSENLSHINYGLCINSSAPYQTNLSFYEIPEKIKISNKERYGLVVGQYNSTNDINKVIIKDLTSGENRSLIVTTDLDVLDDSAGNPYILKSYINKHRLLLGKYDVNRNGFYDHICVYSQKKVLIIDGFTNDRLFSLTFSNEYSYDTQIGFPVSYIQNGLNELDSRIVIGRQTKLKTDNPYCKASFLNSYNTDLLNNESDFSWDLELEKCTPYRDKYKSIRDFTFYKGILSLGDINQDNKTDILVRRSQFYEEMGNSGHAYASYDISEILDPYSEQILFRFPFLIDSILLIQNNSEHKVVSFTVQKGGIIYCINNEYQLKVQNIEHNTVKLTGNFGISWNHDISCKYVAIRIDDYLHTKTNQKQFFLSLGPGWHRLEIIAYDRYGITSIVRLFDIFISDNITYEIITSIIIGSSIGISVILFIFQKRLRNRKYIQLDKKKEDKLI